MTAMNGKGGKRVSPRSQAGARPSHGNVCRARGGMVSVGPGRRTAAAATREPDPKARLHVLRLRRPGRPNILGTSQAAGSPRCRRRLVHEATCRPLPLLPSSPLRVPLRGGALRKQRKDPARERGPRCADPAVSPCPHRYNERMGRGTPTAPRGSRNDSAPAGQF